MIFVTHSQDDHRQVKFLICPLLWFMTKYLTSPSDSAALCLFSEPHRAIRQGFIVMSPLLDILLSKYEGHFSETFFIISLFLLVIAAHLLHMQTFTVKIRCKSKLQTSVGLHLRKQKLHAQSSHFCPELICFDMHRRQVKFSDGWTLSLVVCGAYQLCFMFYSSCKHNMHNYPAHNQCQSRVLLFCTREAKQITQVITLYCRHDFSIIVFFCFFFTKLKAFLSSLLEVIRHPPTVGTFCKSWAFPKIQIRLVICGRWWGVCVCAQGVGTRSNGRYPVLWTLLHTHSHIHKCLGYEPAVHMHINTHTQLRQCDVGDGWSESGPLRLWSGEK